MEFSGARRQFYPHLESLRGVAALCVVLFHVFGSRSPQPGLFAHPTSDAIANLILTSIFGGTGAVTLFFVLSGFVLAESLAECETINVRIYAAFVVRRIFRLIPVAWASLGLAIVLMIYFHHMTPPWDQLPQALLFNISAIQPFNGPLWSINVECMASAVFPLLLLANRKLNMAGRLLMLLGLLLRGFGLLLLLRLRLLLLLHGLSLFFLFLLPRIRRGSNSKQQKKCSRADDSNRLHVLSPLLLFMRP